MSLSMRALVDRKVTNKITQMNNRLAEFATPVMRNYDLYVYRNFVVSGNEEIKGNSEIHGDLTVDGNEEVKGNVTIDGNELVKGDVTVNGNINADGYILAQTFLPGQLINMSMIAGTDFYYTTSTVPSTGVETVVFSYSYTPSYSSSYLIVDFNTIYTVGGDSGGGNDSATATLRINNGTNYVANPTTVMGTTSQRWLNSTAGGTGTRSGTILPITGRYPNTNVSPKTISLIMTSSDVITVYRDISTWLKITEIAR